LGILKAILAHL